MVADSIFNLTRRPEAYNLNPHGLILKMGSLVQKKASVTGTSQGIGAAIAEALIEAGCDICMHYFHSPDEPRRMQQFAAGRKQRSICLHADLRNEQDVVRCVHESGDFLGHIDILVNNSGALVQRRNLIEVDNAFWQSLLDINLKTMMMVTREAHPLLNKTQGASIVNIASLASISTVMESPNISDDFCINDSGEADDQSFVSKPGHGRWFISQA